MTDKPAERAVELEKAQGIFGESNLSCIEEFAKDIMRVYYQTKGRVSDYARHRPLRELLRGYRLYRNFGAADQHLAMAGEVLHVLERPPQGMAVDSWINKADEAQKIVKRFLRLVDELFGGIPHLVTRHANSLIHAYDLALRLHWREIYRERGEEFIKRREAQLEELHAKLGELAEATDKESAKKRWEIQETIAHVEQAIADKQSVIARITGETLDEEEEE